MTRYAALLLLPLVLGACDKGLPVLSGKDDQRSAEGNVEGGSISDAMIPLDSLTSTAPPFSESATAGESEDGAEGQGEGADAADSPPAPATATSEEPATTPSSAAPAAAD